MCEETSRTDKTMILKLSESRELYVENSKRLYENKNAPKQTKF